MPPLLLEIKILKGEGVSFEYSSKKLWQPLTLFTKQSPEEKLQEVQKIFKAYGGII